MTLDSLLDQQTEQFLEQYRQTLLSLARAGRTPDTHPAGVAELASICGHDADHVRQDFSGVSKYLRLQEASADVDALMEKAVELHKAEQAFNGAGGAFDRRKAALQKLPPEQRDGKLAMLDAESKARARDAHTAGLAAARLQCAGFSAGSPSHLLTSWPLAPSTSRR